MPDLSRHSFSVREYDLNGTLSSGQVFRWQPRQEMWEGVVGERWVRLCCSGEVIEAETFSAGPDWEWLGHFLQIDVDLGTVLASFPEDAPMREAVRCCRGLRLLRQEPWECLASFILSSTKQIVQIHQVISRLCERFGEPVKTPEANLPHFSFPSAARLAACGEGELRECKMGFRAPYLLGTARKVAEGEIDLEKIRGLTVEAARFQLMQLPGVGRKIADCVLLFAYGYQEAFPVDVWVMKALRQLYFSKRSVSPERLQRFAAVHFGPNAGYAQQYLFHYMRLRGKAPEARDGPVLSRRGSSNQPSPAKFQRAVGNRAVDEEVYYGCNS
jgi:N-glycosylase/DNA lyase